MLRRFLLGIMVVSLATLAWAGIPDPANSSVTWAAPSGSLVHIIPDGTGTPLNFVFAGPRPTSGQVDGTIEITLLDANNVPVSEYSFEDLWLECDGVAFCAAIPATPSTGSTDEFGNTEWSGALFGGGNGYEIYIKVGGTTLPTPVPYYVNSPDFNADLAVNALDVVPFFAVYGGTDFEADFNWDNAVNALDVVPFFATYGSECPIDP
jgi:hypothetical protein